MAVEKGKVLAAIETKFKGKSLTKNFKENIAAKWAEKIEKDEDIDGYIDDREDLILEASAEADRRAVAAAKKAKEEAAEAVNPEKKDEKKAEEVKVDENTPDWAKKLIDQNKSLAERLEKFEAAGKAKTIAEKFASDDRVKNIPEFIRKGYVPESDDDYETKVTELSEAYKTFADQNKLKVYANDKPNGSTGKTTAATVKDEATDDEVKELLNDLK